VGYIAENSIDIFDAPNVSREI